MTLVKRGKRFTEIETFRCCGGGEEGLYETSDIPFFVFISFYMEISRLGCK